MILDDYKEVVACLRGERTLYHYFPDRYAFMLLGWAAGDGTRLDALRKGTYAPLLQKPAVRDLLSGCGGALVDHQRFDSYWPAQTTSFVLGLDHWHGLQTSRSGAGGHNLVLQLNFSREHMLVLEKRFGGTNLFNSSAHPVQQASGDRRRETLAWARIDLDLKRDEALIEEVQSDWVSTLDWALKNGWQYAGEDISAARLKSYKELELNWIGRQWADAMLAATLGFLRVELGITNIFFHTYEGGNLTKKMDRWMPPRSLYSKLPRRFCMRRTKDRPRFLRDDRRLRRLFRARKDIEFFQLETGQTSEICEH